MADELIGQTLANRYRVDAFIGKGGMAEVYRVWDSRRAVPLAMKLLYPDLAEDRLFLRRFQREAQTLAALQHPHIVRFYGLEQDGARTFMLMDFIDGSTLRREIFELNGSPASPNRLLEILQPVCSALHYAHAQGVAHCDVKPANIMLHRNGTVLVADFGISRLTESATTVTMVGAGTPAYMAPEQVRGENPTPQTDIYALGIVLYELLTGGERPFTGEQARITGSTGEKVRWEQLNHHPPSPRRYNSSISPALEAVVLRCLDKNPSARFPSALALFSSLQSALPGAAPAAAAGSAAIQPTPERASPPLPIEASGSANQPAHERVSSPIPAGEGGRGVRSRLAWMVMAALAVLLLIAGVVFLRPSEPAATAVAAATETAIPPTATAEAQPTSGLVAVALAASDTPAPTSTETPAPTDTATPVPPTPTPSPTSTPTPFPTYEQRVVAQASFVCKKSPLSGRINVNLEPGDYQAFLWHWADAQLTVGSFTLDKLTYSPTSAKFTITQSGTYELRYYFECNRYRTGYPGGYTLTWLQPPYANAAAISIASATARALTAAAPTGSPTVPYSTPIPGSYTLTVNNTRGYDLYIFNGAQLLLRIPGNKTASVKLQGGEYQLKICYDRDRTNCWNWKLWLHADQYREF